jgi:glycine/D-amino acid oxidase-like deaminating enzyme
LPTSARARRRLAILGGGIVGTATAYAAAHLAPEDVEVHLFESAHIGHDGGASIDVSRVFRHAYGENRHYTEWAIEALRLWHALETESGNTLFERTGAAWMAGADEPGQTVTAENARLLLESSYRTMRALGLPCELVDGLELHHRYPQFVNPLIAQALIDPGAGLLRARDAVMTLRELGERHGVRCHERMTATEVRPEATACTVSFADGSSITADVVVMAINGWTPTLLPALGAHIQNTEQPLWYFALAPDAGGEAMSPGRLPIFLLANAQVYGLPLHRGSVKIACDARAREIVRPEDRRLTSESYRRELYDYLIREVPALRDAALMQERVCFYDRSSDGDFILDRWDPEARLIVACGFSGHGFKFGPLTGTRLAQYALTGQPPADLGPFTLRRFERTLR